MAQYKDKNGWKASREIADTHPDVMVDGDSWRPAIKILIKKNQWGVPVYCLEPYVANPASVPKGYLVQARSGNIPGLPPNFGPWISRKLFESQGPFIKDHIYRIRSGPHARAEGKWPGYIQDVIARFTGVCDGFDEFLVLRDCSRTLDVDPASASPLPNRQGQKIGYEHRSPRATLARRSRHVFEPKFLYLGPEYET